MVNFYELRDLISNQNVRAYRYDATISDWYFRSDVVRPYLNDSFNDGHRLNITRADIFNEEDLRARLIKTLVWGYPGDVRNTPRVLNHLDELVSLSEQFFRKEINATEYFTQLLNIDRMGLSTASKILYFMGACFNQYPAIIVDARVLTAFSLINEFAGLRIRSRAVVADYQNAIQIIGNLAVENHVTPEQVEFFLFNLAGSWDKHIKKLTQNAVSTASAALINEIITNHIEKQQKVNTHVEDNNLTHRNVNLIYRQSTSRQLIYPAELKDTIRNCWLNGGHVILVLDDDEILIKQKDNDYQCFRQAEINKWAKQKEESREIHDNMEISATIKLYTPINNQ